MGSVYGTTQKIPDDKVAGDAIKIVLDAVLKL